MSLSSTTRRVLLASLVGSAIEWFDFFLYGTAVALVFNKLYFPTADPLVSLLLSYLSFAVPFFIRPLGAVVFSHIGDRLGRKKTLVLTLLFMGVGTTAIGLLPTYDRIGVLAPILLVALRLVQGIGLGGEWGGAVLLAYEYAAPRQKGLFGSIPQMGPPIGMVLSTLFMSAVSLLPDASFISWGWRIPFVLSAGLVLLGLWIRNGIDETPEFKATQAAGRVARYPVLELVRRYPREVLIATLVKFAETGPFYIFAVFIVGYATKELGYSRLTTLIAVSAGALVATFMIPLCGLLSDRIGRPATFRIGSIGLILVAAPFFWLLSQRSTTCMVVATVTAIGLVWPFLTASLSTLLAEMFPSEVRYSGVSLGYQIGAALVGGTAPLAATLLLSADNGHWRWIAAYIVTMATISGVAAARAGRPIATPQATDANA